MGAIKNMLIALVEKVSDDYDEQDYLMNAYCAGFLSLEELQVRAGEIKVVEVGTTQEIIKKLDAGTSWDEIQPFMVNGTKFVPFTGNLIDEKTAAIRRKINATSEAPLWAEELCQPAYFVTFRPAEHCSWV